MSWSPDQKRLASSADDATIRIWNLESGGNALVLQQEGPVTAVSWSPAAPLVASASIDGAVRLWNADLGTVTKTFKGRGEWFFGVSWAPDGIHLAAAGHDKTVWLWNTITEAKFKLSGHEGIVRAVAWTPAGSILASGSEDGTVRIWDPVQGKMLHSIKASGSMVVDLAWAPNGRTLALASAGGFVELWNVTRRTAQPLAYFYVVPGQGGFAATPDGYVSGPPEALEYVRFGDGWALYDLTDVPERLSPERVAAALNPVRQPAPAGGRRRKAKG